MRPTWPLVSLTVLQGLAGGWTVWLALAAGLAPAAWDPWLAGWARLASGLALAGAVASLFHMHRPQAGRYVLRRLATSWLSREALTTGLYVGALVLTAWLAPPGSGLWRVGLAVSAALGLIAMAVTALLYATIPAMRSWHSPLTVLALVGTGLASGAAVGLGAAAGSPAAPLAQFSAAWVLPGWVALAAVKALQVHLFAQARQWLNVQTGSGLPRGPWRLQDTGTSRPPYRTQPQVWPGLSPPARALAVAGQALWLVALPLATTAATLVHPGPWTQVGAASAVLGAVWERWWFFADATHSSRIWFQDQPHPPSRVATARASPPWVARFVAHPSRPPAPGSSEGDGR